MSGQNLVPYVEGLQEGQGYNSLVQKGCKVGAVSITKKPDAGNPAVPVDIIYQSDLIADYEKLVKSFGISAGFGLSEMDIGGEIKGGFLNRSEFEASFLTYLVRVDVRQQSSTTTDYHFNWKSSPSPNVDYGDRFISDFVKGGALLARVSIITTDTSVHQEVKAAAELAFPVYGLNVKIAPEYTSNMDTIHKLSEVHISYHYVGAPPHYSVALSQGDDDTLLALKTTADNFVKDAQSHDWKRFAILEKYTNTSNWEQQFTPFDYAEAIDLSWPIFNDFTQYLAIQNTIRQIKPEHYKHGREDLDKLNTQASDVVNKQRGWITAVCADPKNVKTKLEYDSPPDFLEKVLVAVKGTQYIAQRLHLSAGKWTDIIDKDLRPKAKKLFGIEAYDFNDVIGITNVIFGQKDSGEEKFICEIGRKLSPGYKEMTHLFASENQLGKGFNQKINVYSIDDVGSIELELEEAGGQGRSDPPLFSFYARKAN